VTIGAVFFDLDGTLVDDDSLGEPIRVTAEAIAATRPGIQAQELEDINRDVFRSYWRETEQPFLLGTMSGDEISREVWRRTLASIAIHDSTVVESAFETFTREAMNSYRLYDDALTILESLGSRMPLAVITNGASDVQRRKLTSTGIESRFKAIMVSGELGVPKPDVRIFLRAAQSLSVEPAAVLHVGDSLESDVAGAKATGMTAVWLNRHGRKRAQAQPEPHHEISSLRELPGILAQYT